MKSKGTRSFDLDVFLAGQTETTARTTLSSRWSMLWKDLLGGFLIAGRGRHLPRAEMPRAAKVRLCSFAIPTIKPFLPFNVPMSLSPHAGD